MTTGAGSGGFWRSGASLLPVALAAALLIAAAIALAVRRPSRRAARARIGSYASGETVSADGGPLSQPRRGGLIGGLERGSWWPPFVEAVEISRNPRSPAYLMKRAGGCAVAIAVLVVLVTGTVALGLVALLAFPFVERWLVFRAAEKQRAKFRDELPSYIQDMASAIRVGRSLVSALSVVAESADEPTRSEFERAVTDESLGRPLEQSLTAVGQRMQSTDVEQVALIAELNRRSGSNVAEALDRVADGARERGDLGREMRALTAQAKMSSSVLTGLPLVMLGALSVISPQYSHPLFHTGLGIAALLFGAGLVFVGWRVMKKITNVGA